MELQYFMILTARAKLYDWDAGSNIPDIKLTPLSSLEAWEIRWDIEEPTLTAITELEAQKMQDDIQRRIAQQIFFAQQNAAHEAGSQVPQGSEFVDGDGANGHNVNIEDDAEMEHGKHENQTLPP
ncbi:hypothetical protein BPOR_0387g00050 [Botrytis porri]|uniref:Uncharacterized protein n=1 Tax=Botrytis porri TaxID=87229 RepID=A0A4Z1KPB2_9HELO|nr:hypothetical protein BPOR_0387g00050 [Botrytis porri]